MKVFISGGDPGGISYEILLKALHKIKDPFILDKLFPVVSKHALEYWQKVSDFSIPISIQKNLIFIEDYYSDIPHTFEIGKICERNGLIALRSIDTALKLLNPSNLDVLLTLSVHKKAIAMAGEPDFMGHTEYLAKKTGTSFVTMVLANHLFAVALVTTHYPLKMVSSHLTKERIIKSASLFHTFAQKMSPNPKILVCALNPHAGDDGLLGDEEKEIIIPAIVELQKEMDIQGPFAADSLFKLAYLNQAHFFMAMYHDQGLIAVKMLGQNKTVNITLGLPFFRISVDHGTAFDIAGQNKANEESFLTTLKWIFCEKNVIY